MKKPKKNEFNKDILFGHDCRCCGHPHHTDFCLRLYSLIFPSTFCGFSMRPALNLTSHSSLLNRSTLCIYPPVDGISSFFFSSSSSHLLCIHSLFFFSYPQQLAKKTNQKLGGCERVFAAVDDTFFNAQILHRVLYPSYYLCVYNLFQTRRGNCSNNKSKKMTEYILIKSTDHVG